MEASDEDFQEQGEKDDIHHQFSEPIDPFQQLAISVSSGEDAGAEYGSVWYYEEP